MLRPTNVDETCDLRLAGRPSTVRRTEQVWMAHLTTSTRPTIVVLEVPFSVASP